MRYSWCDVIGLTIFLSLWTCVVLWYVGICLIYFLIIVCVLDMNIMKGLTTLSWYLWDSYHIQSGLQWTRERRLLNICNGHFKGLYIFSVLKIKDAFHLRFSSWQSDLLERPHLQNSCNIHVFLSCFAMPQFFGIYKYGVYFLCDLIWPFSPPWLFSLCAPLWYLSR